MTPNRWTGLLAVAVFSVPSCVTERPSLAENVRVLRNGVAGTSMAPWTDRLGDDEIQAVAHYVRQFYSGGSGAGGDIQ